MIKIYNKAIRDKIPEIIEARGLKCEYETLPDKEFLVYLEKKLEEEIKEYYQTNNIAELADLLEVIYRIIELRGVSLSEIEEMRSKKNSIRGSFSKNLFLVKTIE
ncbi:MAG: phosphoribosyl-ATP pyrophosphohydrolase [Candidatus Hodarchaeota archaeon]